MFKAICPYCSQDYQLDSALLGKTATCKRCRKIFILEEDTSPQLKTPAPVVREEDSGFDLKLPSKKAEVEPARQQIPDPKFQKRFSPQSGIWNVGDVVLGVYEVKPISEGIPYAEGGVGVVHRVYHRDWDMDLAVKSPKPHVFQTENGKQSYEKEAQTWIELGLHPNIVTCFLVRRITNIPRLFAEFVPDGSLRDWIRDGRLYEGGPEAALLRILDIATQFAWGLEHAHRQKLLHLDVKPANVMMAGQTAKVTDFGLAQGISDAIDTGTHHREKRQIKSSSPSKSDPFLLAPAGGMTPGYCSPEQYLAFSLAQRQEFDKMPKITLQSDVWSWAVSVLSMFHGRPPCKKGGQTARKVFELYLKMDVESPRPSMPDPVVDLLFRCFEEDPEKRPGSMSEIADELVASYKIISDVDFPRPRPVSATWTPDSINNRAASMLDLNKPDEAAELLKQAADMQPWHPEVTYNQALLSWRMGRMTDLETVERIETLAKTRLESPTAQYALGLVQRERGNPSSALDAFENALEMEPREDVRRALLTTEKVASRSARCLERFSMPRGKESDIMVDDAGEFVLLATERENFDLRETSTGRVQNTFTLTPPERRAQFPDRVALSDDLLWELVRQEKPNLFLLRRVGGTGGSMFRQISWKRYFGQKSPTKDSREPITLPGLPWIGEIKDNIVDLYSKETEKKIAYLFGHEDTVTALDFSDDGH